MTDLGSARPLGVALTPLETRREVVLHLAVRAEELGYREFYLAEGWGHDASVLLTEVATRTSQIRLARVCSTSGVAAPPAWRCSRRRSTRCRAGGSRSGSGQAARSSPKVCTTCRSAARSSGSRR